MVVQRERESDRRWSGDEIFGSTLWGGDDVIIKNLPLVKSQKKRKIPEGKKKGKRGNFPQNFRDRPLQSKGRFAYKGSERGDQGRAESTIPTNTTGGGAG